MAVEHTSIETYHELQGTGRLARLRDIVLDGLRAMQRREPPTAYELFERLRADGRVTDLNAVRPRLTELKKAQLVENPGKRICRVTHKRALVWRTVATDQRLF